MCFHYFWEFCIPLLLYLLHFIENKFFSHTIYLNLCCPSLHSSQLSDTSLLPRFILPTWWRERKRVGLSLILLPALGSFSPYWVAFSSINTKSFDLPCCILCCPAWLSLGGLLFSHTEAVRSPIIWCILPCHILKSVETYVDE